MTNKAFTLLILCFLATSAKAVCADSTGYSLALSNQPTYGTSTCNVAQNMSAIQTEETVYINLSGWSGTDLVSVVWKDNGSALITNTVFPDAYQYAYSTSTAGFHQITAVYSFETGCSITKNISFTVVERYCPFLSSTLLSSSHCLFPENELDVLINSDVSIEVINCIWEVIDENNNSATYTSVGDTFHFMASPGAFTAHATATIQLNDSTVCYTEIDGFNCDVDLSYFEYSDPFFQLESDYFDDSDIEVIFKGTEFYPLAESPAKHEYDLYLDAVQTGSTFDNLAKDTIIHTYSSLSAGQHTIKLQAEHSVGGCSDSYEVEFTIKDESEPTAPCEDCNTFKPIVGEKYWISAWVKEEQATQVQDYLDAYIKLTFTDASQTIEFKTTGDIVEGWQRIVGSFTVPALTTGIEIKLVNDDTSVDAFFDDVRIHPFNASMKSYVYDPVTLWLVAELDDNNYATFYEYDLEGQLIRIKKETARGIMTIQETRSHNPKN